MIKDSNYILIPGFAVSKYKLKGIDLLVYSIIYGFSQVRGHWYSGSVSYLAEWCNSSRQAIHNSLNNLLDIGLIEKESRVPTNHYRVKQDIAAPDEDVNLDDTDVNKVYTDVNKVYTGCKESLHNNIDNNTINNINNNYMKQVQLNDLVKKVIPILMKNLILILRLLQMKQRS